MNHEIVLLKCAMKYRSQIENQESDYRPLGACSFF